MSWLIEPIQLAGLGGASFVNLSDKSFEHTPITEEDSQLGSGTDNLREWGNRPKFRSENTSAWPSPGTQVSSSSEPSSSMQEFYQLSQELLLGTLVLTGIIFICVWVFYSLNIALNYLIGACTGVVYLRMLAKDVERLGRGKNHLSKTRLALLIGLILLASQWNQLKIMPIFLGFLTYKAALIFYVIRTAFIPDFPKVGQS